MDISRSVTLPTHGAVELVAGITMMITPLILGFGAAGLVISTSLGAILAGTGVALGAARRDSLVARHSHFDSVFVIATAAAALILAIAGHGTAAIFLAAIVAVQACLSLATRYAGAG